MISVLDVNVCMCACIIMYNYAYIPTVSGDWGVGAENVRAALLPVWKKFLLNQFHDVLPGSCIELVRMPIVVQDTHVLHFHFINIMIL